MAGRGRTILFWKNPSMPNTNWINKKVELHEELLPYEEKEVQGMGVKVCPVCHVVETVIVRGANKSTICENKQCVLCCNLSSDSPWKKQV